jgi:hypothetical protein
MANLQNDEERRKFLESMPQRSPIWVDVLCALALIAVVGGSLAECSGTFDPPPAPACHEATPHG